MNQDKFDQELSQLYQHRKAQVKAPEVALDYRQERSRKWSNRFTILSIAGVSSFAVMAIIANLVPRQVNVAEAPKQQEVEVIIADVELANKPDADVSVPKSNPLPKYEKPEHPIKASVEKWQPEKPVVLNNEHEMPLERKHLVVTIPEPQISPTFKVMPDSRKLAGEVGEITFSYQINREGKVFNVEIEETNLSRKGQRVVRRAFKKWRFEPEVNNEQKRSIKFDISGPSKNVR